MIETNGNILKRIKQTTCCDKYRKIRKAKYCGCCGKKLKRWGDVISKALTLNIPNTE